MNSSLALLPRRDSEPDQLLPELGNYLRYLADAMRLKDWFFEVDVDRDLAEPLVRIEVVHRRRLALLRVSTGFFAADEGDRRHDLVHELARAPLQALRDRVATLGSQMTSPAFRMFQAGCDHEIDTLADEWAATIAPFLLTMQEWRAARAVDACRKGRVRAALSLGKVVNISGSHPAVTLPAS